MPGPTAVYMKDMSSLSSPGRYNQHHTQPAASWAKQQQSAGRPSNGCQASANAARVHQSGMMTVGIEQDNTIGCNAIRKHACSRARQVNRAHEFGSTTAQAPYRRLPVLVIATEYCLVSAGGRAGGRPNASISRQLVAFRRKAGICRYDCLASKPMGVISATGITAEAWARPCHGYLIGQNNAATGRPHNSCRAGGQQRQEDDECIMHTCNERGIR